MRPHPKFKQQEPVFWAYVKLLSAQLQYSERGTGLLRRYGTGDIGRAFMKLELSLDDLMSEGDISPFGQLLIDYLNYRADILETQAEPNLMNRDQALIEFERLRKELNPECPLPMNTQKGKKRHHAFLTCIVNMLTEATLGGMDFEANPRGLATIIRNGKPLRTLSRWMDGAYPSINNPIALWELKEYYGTTTFGSRVADGVYETMLDGLELKELEEHEGIHIEHYLIVDDYFTWWECGKSYLCRLVDMMHMDIVDEVLLGREVLIRWPQIVGRWKYSPSQQ